MSVKIMGAIWDLDIPHAQAWVLMAYADHADHDGKNAYPSVPLIAYKTGYSERQITRIVAELVDAGLLIVELQGGGRGRPTTYRIDLSQAPKKGDKTSPISVKGDKMSPIAPETVTSDAAQTVTSETETVTSEAETVTFEGLKGDIAMSPEPLTVLTVQEPSGVNRPTPPPTHKSPRAETRAPIRSNGGGGVGETQTCPPDFSAEQYVAWNLVLATAPDFNGVDDFVRKTDARLVAYWCLAAGDRPDTVDNPAGLIRAGVEREEWPRLRGELTDQWQAMVRSAAGWAKHPATRRPTSTG